MRRADSANTAAEATLAGAAPAGTLRIGVDLDNTIIGYDRALQREALRLGLVGAAVPAHKQTIRDVIRAAAGDRAWQRLQAIVYGLRMADAELLEGAERFFRRCRVEGHALWVVSHKTEFAEVDGVRVDLRRAARDWMRAQRFFAPEGFGLAEDDVFFEATRREKIQRVRRLRCTHFIDDLAEVFAEAEFPSTTERILYAPHRPASTSRNLTIMGSWDAITEHVFGIAG